MEASSLQILRRVQPHNIEAEQSVIGAMILDKGIIPRVYQKLRSYHFYKDAHQVIYDAIISLHERGEAVDVVTLLDELRNKNLLEKAGGASYILTLVNTVPTPANYEYYVKIVEGKAKLRELIKGAEEITQLVYERQDNVEEVIDQSEKIIFEITQKGASAYFYPIKKVITETWDVLDKKSFQKGMGVGIPTGFYDLDRKIGGLQPSDLIIIAGRTSMGKTSLALNIATNVAIKQKLPVAIFSLEMSKEQLSLRVLCSVGEVDAHALRTGTLSESDWQKLPKIVNKISQAPIYIDETTNLSILELRGKARRLKSEVKNLNLIVVDYLQLMQTEEGSETRAQQIAEISRSLKGLARELNIPVIALSQLSRAIEKREDKAPQLSDLRESGAIEQDADLVIFIHRKGHYKLLSSAVSEKSLKEEDEEQLKSDTKLIIAKHRNGPTGVVEVVFQSKYARFVSKEKAIQPS